MGFSDDMSNKKPRNKREILDWERLLNSLYILKSPGTLVGYFYCGFLSELSSLRDSCVAREGLFNRLFLITRVRSVAKPFFVDTPS